MGRPHPTGAGQLSPITSRMGLDHALDAQSCLGPPLHLRVPRDLPPVKNTSRDTSDYGELIDLSAHNSSRAYHRTSSHMRTGKNDGPCADPHIILNHYRAIDEALPTNGNIRPVEPVIVANDHHSWAQDYIPPKCHSTRAGKVTPASDGHSTPRFQQPWSTDLCVLAYESETWNHRPVQQSPNASADPTRYPSDASLAPGPDLVDDHDTDPYSRC